MAHWRAADLESPDLSGRLGRRFTPLLALQACHMAELTGTLRARSGPRVTSVSFLGGEVIAADSLDSEGIEALVDFAQWSDGRFEFYSGEPIYGPAVSGPFDWVVLEVCHRLDQCHRPDQDLRSVAGPAAPAATVFEALG
jgi:hypothetical protein